MIKEFYYQIKGKTDQKIHEENGAYFSQNWTFPPIFSGKVEATDKKEAKKLIDEQYGITFPLRVLEKDLANHEFLLKIEEIQEGSRIQKLFEKQTCIHCEGTFFIIDKYNDANVFNKGGEFCSDNCKHENNKIQEYLRSQNMQLNGKSNHVIYKITNKSTGLCYIGKTTQIFTLRWYQHFFQNGTCKFHDAINSSKVSDWLFEVQEIVILLEDVKYSDIENIVVERERFWIKEFNSIDNGYNYKN